MHSFPRQQTPCEHPCAAKWGCWMPCTPGCVGDGSMVTQVHTWSLEERQLELWDRPRWGSSTRGGDPLRTPEASLP